MTLQTIDGGLLVPIGPNFHQSSTVPVAGNQTIDAANEAVIYIGQIATSDGGSHTIDTTGSSSIGWRTATVTFANAGTTFKVGIAPVDTATGPPGRASNAADVIAFDVSKSMTGGGGGVTTDAWQTHVPDTGTKTIAHGDYVAVAFQMTARGGADTVQVSGSSNDASRHRPLVTTFLGGSYTGTAGIPNVIITFSDGALGYMYGGDVFSSYSTVTWNNTSGTKEYAQLYKLPFPTKVYGLYGNVDADGGFDAILYSDPLGTPAAEKTVSIDLNTVAGTASRRFVVLFSSPYTTTADQIIGAVFKPDSATSMSAVHKTLASATHRIADNWGVDGYGISRNTGAFADKNSSLDHFYIGLLVGAFDDAAGTGGFVPVLRGPL